MIRTVPGNAETIISGKPASAVVGIVEKKEEEEEENSSDVFVSISR